MLWWGTEPEERVSHTVVTHIKAAQVLTTFEGEFQPLFSSPVCNQNATKL